MIGDVKTKASLESNIGIRAILTGDISSKSIIGGAEIGTVVIKRYEADRYDGDYIIIPSSESQTLETANKILTSDIEIKKIPYYDVSNEYGRTIYIGGEI